MNILRAENMVKRFNKRTVVNDVSIQVNSGEVVGLLGPNGAGKTTSFYMMVGLIPVNEGTITLNQQDITHLPMHNRARLGIGYLPQEASVFRKLTVADNILAILQTRVELNKKQRNLLLQNLLDELQIDHIRDNTGISLSGGERRRVEIARALAAEPEFILLDEPFAGVDPLSVADLQQIIRSLKEKGLGVLISDHNVRETLQVCDFAYIMNNGQILTSGAAADIIESTLARKMYLGDNFSM